MNGDLTGSRRRAQLAAEVRQHPGAGAVISVGPWESVGPQAADSSVLTMSCQRSKVIALATAALPAVLGTRLKPPSRRLVSLQGNLQAGTALLALHRACGELFQARATGCQGAPRPNCSLPKLMHFCTHLKLHQNCEQSRHSTAQWGDARRRPPAQHQVAQVPGYTTHTP